MRTACFGVVALFILPGLLVPTGTAPYAIAYSTWVLAGENHFGFHGNETNGVSQTNIEMNDTGGTSRMELYTAPCGWWKRALPTSPSARIGTMAAFSGTGQALLFGGSISGGSSVSDSWIYNAAENQWVEQYPVPSPKGRWLASMATLSCIPEILRTMYGLGPQVCRR